MVADIFEDFEPPSKNILATTRESCMRLHLNFTSACMLSCKFSAYFHNTFL